MICLRHLVLLLLFFPGGARRSIRIDEFHYDVQQHNETLANGLWVSVESRAALIPGAHVRHPGQRARNIQPSVAPQDALSVHQGPRLKHVELSRSRQPVGVLPATVVCGIVSSGVSAVVLPMLWNRLTVRYEAEKGESASTIFCPIEDASPGDAQLARTMQEIVARCPSLQSPRYVPPAFAPGSISNAALALAKRKLLRLDMVHERLPAEPDLYISWANDRQTRALPDSAPVVAFLHTITGGARQTQLLCRHAASRGWRSVVLVRRGHGGPLARPLFNILGSVEDTRLQMAAVHTRYPNASFLGLVGLSAGSGLLVNYLGQDGDRCLVNAAVGVSPAYDISDAFDSMAESPVSQGYMVRKLKRTFITPNRDVLRADNPAAFDACLRSRSLSEFVDAHAPFALRNATAGAAEYYEAFNPMAHYQGMKRPVLFLNSDDDMVCDPANIREDLVLDTSGVVLLRTKRGSHVAFNEGLLGQGVYLARIAFDFLDAAHEVAELKCDLPVADS